MPTDPSYIVVFKDHVTPEQIKEYVEKLNSNGGLVTHEWSILKGFAANIPDNFLNNLQGDSLIKYIGRCLLRCTAQRQF
ncbi:hypothetical protein BDM02DRAFT_3183313 [Thelephora ganbajun]|uniref:Uncharacterized protein n=1 Tax=Thelephora ganbajun TaxID=370292 RepID=A0ACB6ZTK2_THEGA|nr:hypothetical protein BDM02DRAFT_3183313 [Thelephora ganbajun]